MELKKKSDNVFKKDLSRLNKTQRKYHVVEETGELKKIRASRAPVTKDKLRKRNPLMSLSCRYGVRF